MRSRHWILAAALLVIGPPLAHAQAVTGTLEGRVLSTQGEPLQDAVVTVSGSFLQGTREVTTDQRGRFLLLWLPAGTITVQLRRVGFGPVVMPDVRIGLGVTTSLGDVALEPQAVVLPEIVVSGARPLIDPTTAAAATVLDSARFLALPTERNFRALTLVAPQTNPSPYVNDGVNVAGATGIENGYFADGINITEPRSLGSMDLPFNFVREVQVSTGGYEAEYGRTQGGVVNVITNAGGNDLHGQLVAFYTGDALQATPLWGVGEARIETFSRYDVGGSLGGPVLRDRLWFYAAYNPSFERHDASFPGIQTEEDVRATHLFAGKLSGRLGTATDLTLTLLGDPSRRDYVGPMSNTSGLPPTVTDPRAVLAAHAQGGTAVALHARHRLGDRVFLAWALTRLDRQADQNPRSGPVADASELARFDDHVTNTASGNWGSSETNTMARTAALASVTVLAGRHLVKLGAEYELNAFTMDGLYSRILRDLDTAGQSVYTWERTSWDFNARNAVGTLYVQDVWEVSRRLRLNLGLRTEGQFFSGDTGSTFWIAPEVAPRLGVVYQPGAPGTHKVYASAGRFYEQISMWTVGMWTGLMTWTGVTYPQDPRVDSTGGVLQYGGTGVGEAIDRNLHGQYYDELAAGYERDLGHALRAGVRGTYRTLRWAVEDGARDFASPWQAGNPGRGVLDYLPRASRDYTSLELTLERWRGSFTFLASYVLSRNRGNYTGLYATDAQQPGGNVGPQFDYPWMTVDATGLLPNDHTHVFKFVGNYRFRFGLTVGTVTRLASGAPLSEYATGNGGYGWVFVRPRGTAGRSPTTWTADLRFTYELRVPRGARMTSRVLLDLFNLGNQRRPLTYDQLHYFDAGQTVVNQNYGAVTQYQAPLSARLGMIVDF